MPRWDDTYKGSSNWLKADDIPKGKTVRVFIESCEPEQVGDSKKLVCKLQAKEKALVLNKTNAAEIASAYGDDTDDWIGKEVHLFVKQVDFQGRMVDAIRVSCPRQVVEPDDDDDLPF